MEAIVLEVSGSNHCVKEGSVDLSVFDSGRGLMVSQSGSLMVKGPD